MARHHGLAEKVVDYLRSKEAFIDTAGVNLSGTLLATVFSCSQPGLGYAIHQLFESEVIVLKRGRMGKGSYSNPPHFVLAQGHETGENWKTMLKSQNRSAAIPTLALESNPKQTRRAKTPRTDLTLATSYAECLTKLEKALVDNNQLREQLVTALTKGKALETKVSELQTEIDDLRSSEHQASVELMKANQEITILRSKVLAEEKRQIRLDRQIAISNR